VLNALSGILDGVQAAIEARVRPPVRRATLRGGMLIVALLFGAVGLGMLAWAGFLALSIVYGAPVAALIVGAVALVIAGIVALVGLKASFRAAPPAPAPPPVLSAADLADQIEASAEDIERISRALSDLAARHSGSLVVGALAAGLVFGLTRPPRR